ncbi:nicotinate (nicotinamide) nucleotide adenylyltransferase [Sulfurimonas sp.]|uniref:nicotinate (nicotinamide) nucleotide adenylyltransferase n=1 Tax=Sulfurimonas sp. TaxID=2022749 RepID=UPI0035684510
MESIALFGGSFDPPHNGHKAIVEAAQNLKEIDKVVVMPTYLNPFKSKSHLKADQRLNLVKEMFKDYDNVEVSDFEVLKKQKTASIVTVKHLLKTYDKIYLIIGADNLASLDKWQDYDQLKKLVTFIVATRDNIEIPKKYITLNVDENISSTEIRGKIAKQS